MKPTLKINLINGTWHANFGDTPEASRMMFLFGTTVIPMPFTFEAKIQDILQVVRSQNPQYDVVVL